MAGEVTGNEVLTYADWSTRMGSDKKLDKIIEVLEQPQEIVSDILVMQCNDGTGHKTTIRTGYPEAAWRQLNKGVGKVKSTTAQFRDSCGMLEIYSEVDKSLADLTGDPNGFRASEAKPVMYGMSKQMAETIFYGNTNINPERFLGLAPRYSTVDKAKAASAENVVDAGGTGTDNTSMWLLTFGEHSMHGLMPKGSKMGLQHTDKGQVTLEDDDGGQYEGYREHYKWDLGLTVRDWRYNARVANIDVSLLSTDMDYLKSLLWALIEAEEKIPELGTGKTIWYCNKTVRTALRHAILEKVANNLTWETVNGKRVLVFDNFPVHLCDALLNTEERVV